VQLERQAVWLLAVKQAERLAIEHDPSGKLFNVGPVTRLDDGTVISVEALQRREENRARREAEKAAKEEAATNALQPSADSVVKPLTAMDPQRYLLMEIDKKNPWRSGVSKTQQRKLEALQPKTEPPRPILPSHITLPEGEENFIALWDLTDTELERRVLREKRRKAAERKALRLKQQAGKAERRLARDEKRAVYRRIKETWKAIKEETSREKTRLKAQEEEESKKIAIEVNEAERARAMELCASLGFTLENTEGVLDIKPKALGMKGQEVDFDAIEPSDKAGTIRLKDPSLAQQQQQQKPKNPKRQRPATDPRRPQSPQHQSRRRSLHQRRRLPETRHRPRQRRQQPPPSPKLQPPPPAQAPPRPRQLPHRPRNPRARSLHRPPPKVPPRRPHPAHPENSLQADQHARSADTGEWGAGDGEAGAGAREGRAGGV